MRVLLQNSDGMFWAAPDKWTRRISEAYNFQTRADAAAASRHLQTTGARIYYAFPQTGSNFSVPVRSTAAGPLLKMS